MQFIAYKRLSGIYLFALELTLPSCIFYYQKSFFPERYGRNSWGTVELWLILDGRVKPVWSISPNVLSEPLRVSEFWDRFVAGLKEKIKRVTLTSVLALYHAVCIIQCIGLLTISWSTGYSVDMHGTAREKTPRLRCRQLHGGDETNTQNGFWCYSAFNTDNDKYQF